jgi:hypothetical protein
MKARTAERVDFLCGIITTAVEGGINYWSHVSDYQWEWDTAMNFTSASVTVHEDESDDEFVIDIDKVASAIGKLVAGNVQVRNSLLATLKEANRENEGGEIDADLADIIIQVACFGEIIYG